MAGNANLVVLMGNLTRTPELRYTPKGRPVTTLNLAINRGYRDKNTGEWVENTDFIPVSVWGNQAENCEKYLTKGRAVYVEGRLVLQRWEDANGEKRSRLDVVARNVQFLGSAGGGESRDTAKEDRNIKSETGDFEDAGNGEEDVSEKDVSEKDVSEKDVSEKDVSEKDVSEKDVSEKDVSDEEIPF